MDINEIFIESTQNEVEMLYNLMEANYISESEGFIKNKLKAAKNFIEKLFETISNAIKNAINSVIMKGYTSMAKKYDKLPKIGDVKVTFDEEVSIPTNIDNPSILDRFSVPVDSDYSEICGIKVVDPSGKPLTDEQLKENIANSLFDMKKGKEVIINDDIIDEIHDLLASAPKIRLALNKELAGLNKAKKEAIKALENKDAKTVDEIKGRYSLACRFVSMVLSVLKDILSLTKTVYKKVVEITGKAKEEKAEKTEAKEEEKTEDKEEEVEESTDVYSIDENAIDELFESLFI